MEKIGIRSSTWCLRMGTGAGAFTPAGKTIVIRHLQLARLYEDPLNINSFVKCWMYIKQGQPG